MFQKEAVHSYKFHHIVTNLYRNRLYDQYDLDIVSPGQYEGFLLFGNAATQFSAATASDPATGAADLRLRRFDYLSGNHMFYSPAVRGVLRLRSSLWLPLAAGPLNLY
jgi:hypothetical protein